MEKISSNESEKFLQHWKNEVTGNLTANLTILTIYFVVGVVGNILVLYVYKFHINHTTAERYFIPFLAMSDLCATISGSVSCGIWDFMNENFTNVALCKSLLFILSVTAYTSILLLECIAIQRYLLICRTYNLRKKYRRVMVLCSCIGAACLATPFSVIYDINELYSDEILVGNRCGRSKERFKTFGTVYAILFGSLMIMTVSLLVVLYGKVGCVIYRQFSSKRFKQHIEAPSTSDTADNAIVDDPQTEPIKEKDNTKRTNEKIDRSDNVFGISYIKINLAHHCQETESASNRGTLSNKNLSPSDQHTNLSHGQSPKLGAPSKVQSAIVTSNHLKCRNRKLRNKFSIMFIIITTVSLICYMPVGVIVVMEGVHPTFWDELSKDEFIIVTWLYHTYIINSIANPIIYAFLDREFKTALKSIFKSI